MNIPKRKTTSVKRIHIVKRDYGWAVKKEGKKRASKVYKTKEEAVKGAQKHKKNGNDVVVHTKDGSIQRWEKSTKK